MNIPTYLSERLDSPAMGAGQRHSDITELALMLVGEGNVRQECFDVLRERYPDKDKPNSEFWRAIDGAIKKNPQPATTSAPRALGQPKRRAFDTVEKKEGGGFVVKTFKRQSLRLDDIPKLDVSIESFLSKMFKPGETISICLESQCVEGSDKWIPRDSGHFAKLEKWQDLLARKPHLDKVYEEQAGVWFRINPVKDGNTSGSDDSVTDFRNVLVEFDSLPKIDQWDIMKQSGLPIGSAVDSGGKSIHFLVNVNAKDREEYRQRQERIYAFLAEYMDDKGNHNPSRFSRLPGVNRAGKPQHVVAFDIGAKDWAEWENSHLEDGLPDFEDPDKFKVEVIEWPKIIVEGILRRERVAVFGGGAKCKKTWTLIDLALAVASGGKWLGQWQCVKGRVLYVNLELPREEMQWRIGQTLEAKGLTHYKDLIPWNLRGCSTDIKEIVDKFIRRVERTDFDLIIIDPIYTCLGWRDENKAGDMTDLFNNVMRLVKSSKSTILFAHHFSKGDAHEKSTNDRISGSGVLKRFPDNLIISTAAQGEPEDDPINFDVNVTCRGFPAVSPVKIKWDLPAFRPATGEEIQETKEQKEKFIRGQQRKILDAIPVDSSLNIPDLVSIASDIIGKSTKTARRRLDEIIELSCLVHVGVSKEEGDRQKKPHYKRNEIAIGTVFPAAPKLVASAQNKAGNNIDSDRLPF